MTDYNIRQYKLMLSMLEAFRERKISLESVIAKLKGLLRAVEGPAEGLPGLFKCWGTLEQAYARMLDLGLEMPSAESQSRIDGTVNTLQERLRTILGSRG